MAIHSTARHRGTLERKGMTSPTLSEKDNPKPDWDVKSWWTDIVHEVFDEFYPKQEGGSKERSMALAVQAVIATRMIPAISNLLIEREKEAEERGRKEMREKARQMGLSI